MKSQKNEQANNAVMTGIIIGFASLLIFFLFLGSTFNEVMMLGLFFLFLAIGISFYIEEKLDQNPEEDL